MSKPASTGHIILVVFAALLGITAGLGALVGTAAFTDRPPLFLGAGLVTFCAAYFLGILLATRRVSSRNRRRVRAALFCVGTAVLVGIFAWTALLPMDDRRLPPAPVAGRRFWELPTGSRISYMRVPAEDPARPTPVVFLHGGPDMRGDSEYFGRLARDGFEVYDEVAQGTPPGSLTQRATPLRATSRTSKRSGPRARRAPYDEQGFLQDMGLELVYRAVDRSRI